MADRPGAIHNWLLAGLRDACSYRAATVQLGVAATPLYPVQPARAAQAARGYTVSTGGIDL
jgi:hypothetical protein